MRATARVAKNKQAEVDLAEIRFRGERRLGELMAKQREEALLRVGNPNGFSENPLENKPPTLAEAGIDKNRRLKPQIVITNARFDIIKVASARETKPKVIVI